MFFRILRYYLIFIAFPALLYAEVTGSAPEFQQRRMMMVRDQIEQRGITNSRVLAAMRKVPRHSFVPHNLVSRAYSDRPLPIGEGQTISQPYIVALMTDLLKIDHSSRILEVGTGSGYQAAVLGEIAGSVYTIEIKPKLYQKSKKVLQTLNYTNVFSRVGDGYDGWAQNAPYDGIMITAAVDHIPPPLLQQLKIGGRLVLPLGNPFSYQNLVVVTKTDNRYTVKNITGVLFVPMTGHALDRQP